MDYYDTPRNPMGFCIITLIFGLAGLGIVLAVADKAVFGIALGAVGMVAGGYGINLANRTQGKDRTLLMAVAGIGIMASVMAFMLGLASFSGL